MPNTIIMYAPGGSYGEAIDGDHPELSRIEINDLKLIAIRQPAVANATANLTTNYNVVTTLLGTLVGAMNTTNAAHNELATKFNTLLDRLRPDGHGLIAS